MAHAVVVNTVTDPYEGGLRADGEYRSFGLTDVITTGDGNVSMSFTIEPTTGSPQHGAAWFNDVSHFVSALGQTGDLQNGWVLRQSLWMATDATDPLLNEGTWTDTLKFEISRDFSNVSSDELFDTGNFIDLNYTASNCDIGAGTCATPGVDFDLSTTAWTQVWMEYEVDDLDFNGLLSEVVDIRPVVFLGDFTAGEAKQGILYVDNWSVEIFDSQASANATPLPNDAPTGPVPNSGSSGGSNNGDYNENGTVDAADYTRWRDTEGNSVTAFAAADGDGSGTIDAADYDHWVANFGNAVSTSAAVPEPASLAVALIASLSLIGVRRRS